MLLMQNINRGCLSVRAAYFLLLLLFVSPSQAERAAEQPVRFSDYTGKQEVEIAENGRMHGENECESPQPT